MPISRIMKLIPRIGAIMNSKGITLIESIVVIVLLGIIGLFTFQFVGTSVETYIYTNNQTGVIAEAELAMERMAREIRDANNILLPVLGGSSNCINFTKCHPTAFDSSTNITFQAGGGILERKRGTNTPEPLAENVSNFKVTNNANEIELELTLALTGGEEVTLHTKIYPKNLPFASKRFGGAQFEGDWEEIV